MRSKTLGINVRVTPEEKEKLLKNADYCALSLSEYLRRLGLGRNSNVKAGEKPARRKPKVSCSTFIGAG